MLVCDWYGAIEHLFLAIYIQQELGYWSAVAYAADHLLDRLFMPPDCSSGGFWQWINGQIAFHVSRVPSQLMTSLADLTTCILHNLQIKLHEKILRFRCPSYLFLFRLKYPLIPKQIICMTSTIRHLKKQKSKSEYLWHQK